MEREMWDQIMTDLSLLGSMSEEDGEVSELWLKPKTVDGYDKGVVWVKISTPCRIPTM